VLVIGLGWFLSWYLNSPVILIIAIVFSIAMNITAYWYSDKIVLKLHKAVPATREKNFDLWNATENLAITAGLPMPKLYIINDLSPNAFATGRDKKHAVVVVTTGLLKILDKNEVEGVIAHELSHIGNKDMLVSTMIVVLAGFVVLLSDFFIRATYFGGGRNKESSGSLGSIFVIVGVVLAILAPFFATLIQLSISRKREFLADASGALLTRYPEGLASALKKISEAGAPLSSAQKATAHLFIANPFGNTKKMSRILMTHPPVEDRIKALLGSK